MNQEADIQAVIQAEEALAAAHLSLDLDTIDRLLHPDYVIIQPNGQLEDKAATLNSLRSDQRHWEIAQSDQLEVRLYGETAIVVGRWRGKGHNGPESFDYQARFLSIWVREKGLWRNVAYEAAPL